MLSSRHKASFSRRHHLPKVRILSSSLSLSLWMVHSVAVFIFVVVAAATILGSDPSRCGGIAVVESFSALRTISRVPSRHSDKHHRFQRVTTRTRTRTTPITITIATVTTYRPERRTRSASALALAAASGDDNPCIDYQSDAPTYGRGENHLSAVISEGDTVVYRTGYWYVDGSLVGDEYAPVSYELCRVGSIQLVWTHNCEHGVLRGLAVDLEVDLDQDDASVLALREPLEDVEFGPEQLIARIRGVEWQPKDRDDDNVDENVDGEGESGVCPVSLDDSMWLQHDGHAEYDEWASL